MQTMTRSGFGDVPNDFEAGYDLQYTPVRQSWYVGYPVTGGGYESQNVCPNGLGASAVEYGTPAAARARIQRVHRRRMFGDAATDASMAATVALQTETAAAIRRDQLRTGLAVVSTLASVAMGIVIVTRAIRDGQRPLLGRRRGHR